jgi:RNA polymerase sigma-70 factor, ECF subfamily
MRGAQRVAEGDQEESGQRRIHDERSLLHRLATGDERALEALFIAHAGRLHRVAHQYLHSAWAARAVVQDVFTALWIRRASIKVRGPLGSYLTAAVRNQAQSVLREEVRRRERDARWAESTGKAVPAMTSAAGSGDGVALATGIAGLDAQLRNGADVQAIVTRALAELPERQQMVFRLRVEQHMSNLEVRNAIGAVSVKAVERVFARAVKTLRARLLTNGGP